jgi:hypothetical protein
VWIYGNLKSIGILRLRNFNVKAIVSIIFLILEVTSIKLISWCYYFFFSSHVPDQGTAFPSPGFVMVITTALITKMKRDALPSHALQHSLSAPISSSAFRKRTNVMAFRTVMMGAMSRAVVSSTDFVCFMRRTVETDFNHEEYIVYIVF